jgi:protein ImuA
LSTSPHLTAPARASPSAVRAAPADLHAQLPSAIAAAVWHADQIGHPVTAVQPTGFAALDAELPGGGWPGHAITELLQPQPAVVEWRLLGPALKAIVATGRTVVLVGPPKHPHLPGLLHTGIDQRHLVWLQAETPAERLWCTEQLVKSGACGAIVAWLPQARQEQIRRLQVCAQASEGLVFLCRPAAAEHEASAAPLRLQVGFGADWELRVHVLKRRGPVHGGLLRLPSVPGGLASVLTPRVKRPSRHVPAREHADVVGSPVVQRQPVATH